MNENELFQAALGLLPPGRLTGALSTRRPDDSTSIWIFPVAVSLPVLFAGFCARPMTQAN